MITVTAATGHLGRLVVADLLERGVPASDITAAVRTPEKAADLGVRVVKADYDEPDTLAEAFAGTDRLLFISASEAGARSRQHRNVVEAARAANVGLIAYTGILKSDTTSLKLAQEHQETEAAIKASGLPFVFLRNGWYLENYTGQIAQAVENGVVLGASGDGRVSAAARADFAAAAAAVLVDPVPGSIYELGGDEAFTLSEYAAEVSRQSGTPVVYRDLPEAEYAQTLAGFGIPQPFAEILADSDRGLAAGDLFTDSGDLRRLIGRPTTSLADAVGDALKSA
ncbi:SDR family oxidoreductase [Cryptosporangium phraense]|uniref:SDR family oxidoreductase n=1 Tax=Cryptosporangium phraense TaxID=2593070 RepID=A0A545AFY5_9ACTN|nr:SDR family oxidoreductase [Cryptosporangium phraense]TQS40246.1 SDR family oxidoreductase [Cryptosporangium phraense]